MKSDFILPKRSSDEIRRLLSEKEPFEDLEILDQVETILKKKKGYIFKIPPKNSNVILLLSGGLDTVVLWDILMRKYELNVYPVFLRRGQIRMPIEEAAVDYFAKYYVSIHPNFFHSPMKLSTFIPPLEIRWDITKFGTYPINNTLDCRGIPMYSSLLVNYAVQYAYYLEIKYAIRARSIFCGVMPGDGMHLRYENLTAMRMNTFNILTLTGDPDWQFTSIAIEKELGYYLNKEDLIRYSNFYSIPIQYSFSCIKYSYYHCGKCIYCQTKKKIFKNARVKDKTIYLDKAKFPTFFNIWNKFKLIWVTFFFTLRLLAELIKNFIYFLKYRY